MNGNFFASTCLAIFALFLTFLQIIIYIIKKRKSNILSKIFLGCSITAIVVLILEILSTYLIIQKGDVTLTKIVSKCFIGGQYFIFFMFTLYSGYVYFVKEENFDNKANLKYVYIFLIVSVVLSIIIGLLFPVTYNCGGEFNTCALGNPFMIVSRIAGSIGSAIHGTLILLSRKKFRSFNMGVIYFAVAAYVAFFTYYTIFDINTGFTTSFLAITSTVLFLTFENQDAKLLDEYDKLDLYVSNSEDSKKTFLLKLSHFYRSKYSTILGLSSTKSSIKNSEIFSKDLLDIEENNNELLNISSSVLDIINIDNKNYLNEYKNYSLANLINEVKKIKPTFDMDIDIDVSSNANINDIKCYGDYNFIYKAIKCLILASNYHSICNKIYIKLNISNDLIEYNVSYYDGNLNDEIFNQKFEDFLQHAEKSIEEYNIYLISTKTYLEYINSKIEFKRDSEKMCNFKFSIPKIMVENSNGLINSKDGEDNAL